MTDEVIALKRAREQWENSTITPQAAVILYQDRIQQAESQGHLTLASYYRSLLATVLKRISREKEQER